MEAQSPIPKAVKTNALNPSLSKNNTNRQKLILLKFPSHTPHHASYWLETLISQSSTPTFLFSVLKENGVNTSLSK